MSTVKPAFAAAVTTFILYVPSVTFFLVCQRLHPYKTGPSISFLSFVKSAIFSTVITPISPFERTTSWLCFSPNWSVGISNLLLWILLLWFIGILFTSFVAAFAISFSVYRLGIVFLVSILFMLVIDIPTFFQVYVAIKLKVYGISRFYYSLFHLSLVNYNLT